jgi:hypothetical protein
MLPKMNQNAGQGKRTYLEEAVRKWCPYGLEIAPSTFGFSTFFTFQNGKMVKMTYLPPYL